MERNSGGSEAQHYRAGSGDYLRQLAVIVAVLAMVGVNWFANALPINDQLTGQVSARFPSLFTPAGYVFSIWGLIYFGLLAGTVYQALPAQRTNPRLRAIGWPWVLSCIANAGWIFFWHYNRFAFSLLAMVALLSSLILVYRRLAPAMATASAGERWTIGVPFSIYLGWISVATIANTAILLLHWQWSGAPLSPALWTVIMLLVALALGLIFALRERNAAYTLVLIWAFAGIAVKQADTPAVAGLALTGALVLAGAIAAGWRRSRHPG